MLFPWLNELFPETSENWSIPSSLPRFFVSKSREKDRKKRLIKQEEKQEKKGANEGTTY